MGIAIVPEKWSQRKSDISFYDTIRELTDNSVDAKAKNITIIISEDTCAVCDDGEKSMNAERLNACFIEGRSDKDEVEIGSFGVGLKQSVVQLNSDGSGSAVCHMLSGTLDYRNKPFYGYVSVCPKTINENIEKLGAEGWTIEPAINLTDRPEKNHHQWFLLKMYSEFVIQNEEFNTGTVALFTGCDVPELKDENLLATRARLLTHLGERYYELLVKNQIKIAIRQVSNNGKYEESLVSPIDWLMRPMTGTTIFEFEHTEEDKPTPLIFRIAVTHQNNYLVRVLKQQPYQNINSENSGISLCFNGVMVAFATKNQIVTPKIQEAYRMLGTKGKREKIFFNQGDNYSSQLRVLVYADGHWADSIYMDESKNAFTFSDKLAPVLAQLMVELDKAKKYSETMKDNAPVNAPTNPPVNATTTSTKTSSHASNIQIVVNPTTLIKDVTLEDLMEIGWQILEEYPEENRSMLFDFSSRLTTEIVEKLGL